MKRRRNFYMIQPAGSECWVEVPKAALAALQEYHGKNRVDIDRRETPAGNIVHFLSIKPA